MAAPGSDVGPPAGTPVDPLADLPDGPAVDLAGRALGGVVVACSDEFFADASSLLLAHPAVHDPGTYGPRGKVYDGWETRRRRGAPGHDWVVVRLGAPGVVERVEVDTAHFRGNFPTSAWLDGAWLDGAPGAAEVAALPEGAWTPLVAPTPLTGDAVTTAAATGAPATGAPAGRRVSHVRLSIAPDGGVARLRVLGRVVPDPALLTGTLDLAAAELGGRVLAASDEFYGSAARLLLPGRAATMADGWENARRRDGGHDWVLVALGAPGVVRRVEVDATCFVGNAPGRVVLRGADLRAGADHADLVNPADLPDPADLVAPADLADPAGWPELLDLRPAPDTRHVVALPPGHAVSHVRLEAHPDGGLSRLRVWGDLDDAALAAAAERWAGTAP